MKHRWDVSPEEAVAIQQELARQVKRGNGPGPVNTVAGVDVGFYRNIARAAVAVLSYPELAPVNHAVADRPVTFPYIPGLLSFREGPAILDALEKLANLPDVLIFDGHGVAHPRRLGLASHIGLLVNRPAIGCAKSRLCGRYREPDTEKGSYTLLEDKGEVIGAAVRTRRGVRPVFVSIGHRIDLPACIEIVLACCRRYRLPETTRRAHHLAAGGPLRSPHPALPDEHNRAF